MNKLIIGIFAMFIVTSILLIAGCTNNNSMIKDTIQKNSSAGDTMMQVTNNTMENNSIMTTNVTTVDYMPKTSQELKKLLTPMQYTVTQENGTEPSFNNAYWNNEKEGIYVDIVSGEPLFSSTDKFDSGTGWPSFTKPLVAENIVERTDYSMGVPRTEVRSLHANSHLGHVFNDGPAPTGLRYCMNSAALKFIPKEDLEKDGYSNYTILFN